MRLDLPKMDCIELYALKHPVSFSMHQIFLEHVELVKRANALLLQTQVFKDMGLYFRAVNSFQEVAG